MKGPTYSSNQSAVAKFTFALPDGIDASGQRGGHETWLLVSASGESKEEAAHRLLEYIRGFAAAAEANIR